MLISLQLELRILAKRFAGILGAQLATAAIQLATVVLVAHSYGPTGNGVYVVSMLLPTTLATFFNLGINSANVYFLGNRTYGLREVLSLSLFLNLVLGVLGLLIGGAIIGLWAHSIFPGIGKEILWVALFIFPAALGVGFVGSIFHGKQQFKKLTLCTVGQPAIVLSLIFILHVTGERSLLFLVLASLSAAVITLGVSLFMAYPLVKESGQPTAMHRPYLRPALDYGFKAYLSNLFTYLQGRADSFLINLFLNPAAAGIYAISFQLAEKLWMISHAVSVVILPKLSELSGNEHRRVEITTVVARVVFFISIVAGLSAAAIAYPFIGIVFGPDYKASYLPFLLLLPGTIALGLARVLANDIAARGRPELNMYMALFGLVITVAGNVALVPRFGISGAAIVASGAYFIDMCLKILTYRMLTKVSVSRLFWLDRSELANVAHALKRGRAGAAIKTD